MLRNSSKYIFYVSLVLNYFFDDCIFYFVVVYLFCRLHQFCEERKKYTELRVRDTFDPYIIYHVFFYNEV